MARFNAEVIHSLRSHAHEGQGLVEYAMLLVLIAMVCVAGVTLLGGVVSSFFGTVSF